MFLKTLAITAMTLGLATGAFAQSSSDSGSGAGGVGDSPMQAWEGEIGDAFFSDAAAGKLRPEGEAMQRFAALTPAQQDKVRNDCKMVNADTAANPISAPCGWVNAM